MDESGEIKATGFNSVVDEFYDRLQEGKVYYISKARVNLAKKKFSNIQNDYELSIERNTEVEECLEPSSVPMIKYNFIPLGELDNVQKDATCGRYSQHLRYTTVLTFLQTSSALLPKLGP